MVRQRGQANLDVVRDTFMYIPLIESIEQLLQNQDILELVINQPAERMDGFILIFKLVLSIVKIFNKTK